MRTVAQDLEKAELKIENLELDLEHKDKLLDAKTKKIKELETILRGYRAGDSQTVYN